MWGIAVIVYILGSLLTHYIIYNIVYKRDNEYIEHETANVVCTLWPVAWMLWAILWIEDWFKDIIR